MNWRPEFDMMIEGRLRIYLQFCGASEVFQKGLFLNVKPTGLDR
jgi:hypothetical protein